MASAAKEEVPEEERERKIARVRGILRELGGVLVAFSGGVDSSVLLALAAEELGDRAVAVTAVSPLYARSEIEAARETARRLGVRQILVKVEPLEEIEGFADNPPERCYICKRFLFGRFKEIADREGLVLCHGEQADDVGEDRPGQRAARELGVRAPLAEAGMTKADVREVARRMGLPAAKLPSLACYATRFPFGTKLTAEAIERVAAAEEFLFSLGFSNVRVRVEGNVARIEVPPEEIERLVQPQVRQRIVERLGELGFGRVAADLAGYRAAS